MIPSYSEKRLTTSMQDFETICPYPGLRPFTEEESLYFKGREEQIIKLTGMLEEKKFLMVTGASGDGKSSLIYGGLIPQARAGFFMAPYTAWHVAAFRPERSPMKNLSESLSRQLGLDAGTTTIELSRGFSSLVELYKSSSLFLDKGSRSWLEGSEEQRNRLERQAGNLLIIIDQFEEFFTNPENFTQGVPSQDSRLLLNIILETSKISLRDNLPIYVVCTMRSDYIGQCAAFSGLPEFIGFSQFFVPRLQRRELQQAIEMPATLSGNRISKRLTDRLISDLEEGIDQLPILQHALKQIWKASDQGRKEMDLIHYAMVGGMDGEKLPREDLEQFRLWKENLPEYEKRYLDKAGLSNVLDIHANKLYEEAAANYNRKAKIPLTIRDAKLIIGLSFSCLTRIDENRAVRNRMTLQEITNIINIPEFTSDVVAGVLRIFREPDNTLVRPFLEQETDFPDKTLGPETVFDITHEALIRNWQLLKKWSGTEYEYYSVFLDLKQQLNRWIDSSKSTDYLLPIGPLTYFEKWNKECRPNKYWINRYNDSESAESEKLTESESILQNLRKFLRKSALQLVITRTFMKYGAAKISKAVASILILGIGIFLIYNLSVRRNDVVISKLINEGTTLINDIATSADFKADFILSVSRLDTTNTSFISRQVTDNQMKIDIALKIFDRLYLINKESDPPVRRQALFFADSLIRQTNPLSEIKNIAALNRNINNLNALIRNQSYYLQAKTDENMRERFNNNKKLLGNIIFQFLTGPYIDRNIDIKALNTGIENTLNFMSLNPWQINEITNSISPFRKDKAVKEKFEQLFPPTKKLNVGFTQKVSHNGGYEKLAYLYASRGDAPDALRCLDSLNKYNDNYDQNWNNSLNIAGYFLMYGHMQSFRDFVRADSKLIGVPNHILLKSIVNVAGIQGLHQAVKFVHGNYNENLSFFDYDLLKELFATYKSSLEEEIKDKAELDFSLALFYKQQGVVYNKVFRETNVAQNMNLTDSLFSIACKYYTDLPSGFLEGKVEIYISPAAGYKEKVTVKRREIFLYPDHFKVDDSFTTDGGFRYYGDAFFNYMVCHDLITGNYHDQDDYKLLINWIDSYFEMYGIFSSSGDWNRAALNYTPLSQNTLLALDSVLIRSGYAETLDDIWINQKLANDYFETGDSVRANERVKRLKYFVINRPGFTQSGPFNNMQINIARQLAIHGKRNEAMGIVEKFSSTKNKLLGYSKLAAFTKINGLENESKVYQDSAFADLKRIKFFRGNQGNQGLDYRTGLVEMLTLQDNGKSKRHARELISAMEFDAKLSGVIAMVRTQSRMNKYYKAMSSIPGLANPEDKLRCINAILYEEVQMRSDGRDAAWSPFDKNMTAWINYTDFIYDLFEF